MQVIETPLSGVLVLQPKVHYDVRGYFLESYSARTLAGIGIHDTFVQDNQSRSSQRVLRGLHYQINPGQAKLVRAISGAIFDVAVDIRYGSPTFGRWFGQTLSSDNHLQLYVPVGFAHGFCVLSDSAEIAYKISTFYAPQDERGIAWDDPEIGIDWPVTDPIVSERDQHNPQLAETAHDFLAV